MFHRVDPSMRLPLFRKHCAISKRDNHASIRGVTYKLIALPYPTKGACLNSRQKLCFLESLCSTFAFPPCVHHCCWKFNKVRFWEEHRRNLANNNGGRGDQIGHDYLELASIPHPVTRGFFFFFSVSPPQ